MVPGQISLPRFVHRFRDADIYIYIHAPNLERLGTFLSLSSRNGGKRYNFHASRACQTRDEALIILGCGEREREREEEKERKKKKNKRRVEEAARTVSVGNISRPCHFSNSGSCIPDIRAKCPRFSRVHSSDREADSVSINYAGRSPRPRFLFIHRGDGLPQSSLDRRTW